MTSTLRLDEEGKEGPIRDKAVLIARVEKIAIKKKIKDDKKPETELKKKNRRKKEEKSVSR